MNLGGVFDVKLSLFDLKKSSSKHFASKKLLGITKQELLVLIIKYLALSL